MSVIIIVDFSQVMLSNIMIQIGNHTNAPIEESMFRHMVLNSIRSYRTKFSDEYGEMIIACDTKNYWRKQIFPYYKANRKKSRDSSELDWKSIFECLAKIKQEIRDTFPYRVVEVETAEADDVIATLCMEYGVEDEYLPHENVEPILILSSDKDFIQLHRFKNVKQYDPVIKKAFVKHPDPVKYLREHIIKGDTGDGVPNFLSPDNCLVLGERQKPIMGKKLDEWVKLDPEKFCTELQLRNYKRNEQLIDLTKVPADIRQKVMECYAKQASKKSGDLLEYFMTHRLKNLMENIGEFA